MPEKYSVLKYSIRHKNTYKKHKFIVGESETLYLPIVNTQDTHYLLKPSLQYRQVSENVTYVRRHDH